jgi:tetratricopeptide (TPR) repeat protein
MHAALIQASERPGATAKDWFRRCDAALRSNDLKDATFSMATIARRWPDAMKGANPRVVMRLALREPANEAEWAVRFDLLDTLYDNSWKMQFGIEPGAVWGELVRELVANGESTRALEVAAHIDSPRTLVALRVDNRCRALVAANPQRFDVAAAAERQIEAWRGVTQQFPRSLEAVVRLDNAYLDAGQYAQVKQITDAVIAKVDVAKSLYDIYQEDDLSNSFNWILDNHADALEALQDWTGAEEEYRRAAERLERGYPNVSNIINLAGFYADLDRNEDARAALARLPTDRAGPSPYGRLQAYIVRLRIALSTRNKAAENEALGYLRQHSADALSSVDFAFARANRLDEAAQLLIQRLDDPHQRVSALMDVQTYANPPEPRLLVEARSRWKSVVERKDVQEAIARVGKIESFPIPSQAH